MYVAMATAGIWIKHFLEKWISHFKCFCKHKMCVCGLFVEYMQLHTHQIYRNMNQSYNIAPSVFVLASYVNTMALTPERH